MKEIPVRKIGAVARSTDPGRFNIRSLDLILNGSDLLHDLHRHDFYFLLAVEKGSGVHEIDFFAHPVENNTIFLLRPGQVHKLHLSAGSTGYLMEFDAAFYHSGPGNVNQLLKKGGVWHCATRGSEPFSPLIAILNSIYNESSLKAENHLDTIKAYLDILFIQLLRRNQQAHSDAAVGHGYEQERFDELMALMEEQVTEQRSVSDYARQLSLSSYQLNAITKAVVGKTVSELINEQKLLESKRLLLATRNQVKDIAWRLGYEDVSYFIRFFRNQTGLTPESFRKAVNQT